MARLRIGCLAWGSLLWDPRMLPVAADFRRNGPVLPIEFSRVSLDGRVTLVIDSAATGVPTWWVPLDVESLDEAVTGLGIREQIPPAMRPDHVGRLSLDARVPHARSGLERTILDWLREKPLDAVVWTALPTRGPDGESVRPDFARLLGHLESLRGAARARAEEYIRRAPRTVQTSHRRGFERALGWTPDGGTAEPVAKSTRARGGSEGDRIDMNGRERA